MNQHQQLSKLQLLNHSQRFQKCFENLERSLKFGDEVGGHILSGHISCRAPSRLIRKIDEVELVVECPKEWSSYILHKGYVAINGASLTVAEKQEGSFSVYLIPETLNATNLSKISDGDLLNIEIDQATYAAIKAAEERLKEAQAKINSKLTSVCNGNQSI